MDFARNTAAKVAQELPIEIEDAIQIGYEGLVQAAHRFDISKFDPTLGDLDNNFRSFAYPRIRGAVIDKSRSDSFVKRRGLEKGLHFEMQSMDAVFETDNGEVTFQIEALNGDPDLVIDFERAVKTLTDRERHILMSLAVGARGCELATELGVSESRISQVATEARHKLALAMQVEDKIGDREMKAA